MKAEFGWNVILCGREDIALEVFSKKQLSHAGFEANLAMH